MSMYKYGIGGNEVKVGASDAIADIPANRTLIAQKLTQEAPFAPDSVEGLSTPKEVFEHFEPAAKVTFEDSEGQEKAEMLKFNNLGDFGAKAITKNSKFLSQLNVEKEQYDKITRQLSSNKALRKALEDPETKDAIVAIIKNSLAELATAKQDND